MRASMYIHVCTGRCVCMSVCMHTYVHTCMCVHMHMRMYVHVHVCVHDHNPDCMCAIMYSVLLHTAYEGKEGNNINNVLMNTLISI